MPLLYCELAQIAVALAKERLEDAVSEVAIYDSLAAAVAVGDMHKCEHWDWDAGYNDTEDLDAILVFH